MIAIQYSTATFSGNSQRGVVLIVGLIVVVLISIVALGAMKGSRLQEAMVGNTRDRNIAFQAAESGLNSGESVVDEVKVAVVPVFKNSNGTGLFEDQDAVPSGSVSYYTDATFATKGKVTSLEVNTSSKPIYMVEELTTFTDFKDGGAMDVSAANELSKKTPYRITALGAGLTTDSTVVVQSYYHRTAQ